MDNKKIRFEELVNYWAKKDGTHIILERDSSKRLRTEKRVIQYSLVEDRIISEAYF